MSRTNEGMTTWLESLAMNSLKAMPNDVSAGLHRLPGGSVFGDIVDEDHDDNENSGQDAEDGGVARWACHTQAGTQRLEAGQNGRGNTQEGGAVARRVRGGGNRTRACKEGGRGVHGQEVQVEAERNGCGSGSTGDEGQHRVRMGCQKGCAWRRRWMRDGTASSAPHSRGRRGVEWAQVVAVRNGHGSAQKEAAVTESTGGGTDAGGGYSIEGGMGRAWLGGGISGSEPTCQPVAELAMHERIALRKGTLEEQRLCRGEEVQLPVGRRDGSSLRYTSRAWGRQSRGSHAGGRRHSTHRSPRKSTTYVTTPPDILTSMRAKALKEHKFGDVHEYSGHVCHGQGFQWRLE
ncbi:hypothetical protein B0H14DRAFT_2578143 [Mycena olivaceomarginata]|nr:hypothetical protein B0H14DRAFT_2578143 [Mycena olivaceomarginata]